MFRGFKEIIMLLLLKHNEAPEDADRGEGWHLISTKTLSVRK